MLVHFSLGSDFLQLSVHFCLIWSPLLSLSLVILTVKTLPFSSLSLSWRLPLSESFSLCCFNLQRGPLSVHFWSPFLSLCLTCRMPLQGISDNSHLVVFIDRRLKPLIRRSRVHTNYRWAMLFGVWLVKLKMRSSSCVVPYCCRSMVIIVNFWWKNT